MSVPYGFDYFAHEVVEADLAGRKSVNTTAPGRFLPGAVTAGSSSPRRRAVGPGQDRPGLWQEYSWRLFHHTLGVATLDVGGTEPWRIATTQLSPASPEARITEANLLAMTGLGDPATVTFLGADFNATSAEPEPAPPGQDGHFYDPEPYQGPAARDATPR